MDKKMSLTPALLEAIITTQEHEITCSECFELLDEYVELLQSGADPAAYFPQVANHLDHCPDCDEECQALLSVLQAIAGESGVALSNSRGRWPKWFSSLLGQGRG